MESNDGLWLFRNLTDQLALVGSVEVFVYGDWSILEAIDHVDTVLELAFGQPLAQILKCLRSFLRIIEADKSFDTSPLEVKIDKMGEGRPGFVPIEVVLGDHPALHDPGLHINESEGRIEDLTPNIVEVHVDPLGAGCFQVLNNRSLLVVDGCIKAQILLDPATLFIASSDSDNTASFDKLFHQRIE